MSRSTPGERLPTLQTQPESERSSRPRSAQPDPEAPREISPLEICRAEGLLTTNVEAERLIEQQALTLITTKHAVPQTSSTRFNLPVVAVPSTTIEANGLTRSQASTLDATNLGAVNPTRQTSSARPNLTVAVVPLPTTSPEIDFSPAKPHFQGCISEPKGLPLYIGGYSDVWRCRVRFSSPSEVLPREVAVKILRFVGDCNSPNTSARLQMRLKQETRTWNDLDHPNIVPLIGWIEGPRFWLISPWYNKGSLSRHLNNLSELQKVRLLLGIAKGLEYLHSRSPPVVHGDVKPGNILLSDQGEPLLADFGLSTILGEEETYTSSHRFGGSPPWMSPECIREKPRSCQSDVYSFGSLAFTVMSGTLPYAGLTHNQITLRVYNDKNPKGPVEDWSKYPQLQGWVKDLLKECWALSPNARPSMPSVVQRLTTLLESYESGTPAVSSEPEAKIYLKIMWLLAFAVILIGMALCKWAIQ